MLQISRYKVYFREMLPFAPAKAYRLQCLIYIWRFAILQKDFIVFLDEVF